MNEVLHHYVEIMSDPAHLMAEITLMILIDVLFLGLIWPLVKNRMHKVVDARVAAEHVVIDAEHGITHGPDGSIDARHLADASTPAKDSR